MLYLLIVKRYCLISYIIVLDDFIVSMGVLNSLSNYMF